MEERISEQASNLLEYFKEQKGKDFDPAEILMKSVANVVCHISFGEHFDSSSPDFEELLRLNNESLTDTKLCEEAFILDLFPLAKYFSFESYIMRAPDIH